MSSSVLRLSIQGRAGALEAIAEDPGVPGVPGVPGPSYAVVCHPHPLFGGTMQNKVVTTVARALQESGIPTLRFNFRGVGASGGAFDQGVGETDDAQAVAWWGAQRWPGRTLVLAGFSFGGYVALRLAQQRDSQNLAPRLLITIAPAVQSFDAESTPVPRCPWLIIQGDADDVVDPAAVIHWATLLRPKPQLLVLQGAGHFFHGRLPELREAVRITLRGG